jgi:general secretion pathway protein A
MGRLYRLSKGIPRVINVLCDRALLGAYVEGKERVDRAVLDKAAREVFGQGAAPRRGMLGALTAALVLTAGGAMAWVVYQREQGNPAPKPVVTAAAMTAPAVKQPPPALERVAWPPQVARASGTALAYAALFRAWGAEYGGGDACRQAEAMGLRCKTDRGGLDELREANRPALLRLRDGEGREFDVALTSLEDRSATLSVGGETRVVALSALANEWTGRYTVLWRLPPGAFTDIAVGARGPAVAWLRLQLAQWRGRAATPQADPVFDDDLTRDVKQFQLAEGLVPDGIVGPRTLMRLSGVSHPEAPRLAPARAPR